MPFGDSDIFLLKNSSRSRRRGPRRSSKGILPQRSPRNFNNFIIETLYKKKSGRAGGAATGDAKLVEGAATSYWRQP
jgi:hypothetical protein